MSDRMDALEAHLERMENGMEDLKPSLLAEMSKLLGKKSAGGSNGQDGDGGFSADSNSTQPRIQPQEGWDEFRLFAKKVELLAFGGNDPIAWITRAETYFEVQRTSEEVRLQLAKLSMEGTTIHCFNLWKESTEKPTWDGLKEAMVTRFGVRRLENPFEELKELRKSGSIEEYITDFELFSSQCGKLPENQFFGYFIGGL